MGTTMKFTITGMTCDNCVHHVTEAIKSVAGVKTTDVSLATNSAKVEGDFDAKAIIAAVEEEGFEAAITS
jgi:copper chaperone